MVSTTEWNVEINIKRSLCGNVLGSPDSLLQLVTNINSISLKIGDVSVCIFQYMPCLARNVRDKLISDPWFVWISNCCCKTPQVIFTTQRNREKYWDATACELRNFLGKEHWMGHNSKLCSVNRHSHPQVLLLFSFPSPLKCWNKNLPCNADAECVKTNLISFLLKKRCFRSCCTGLCYPFEINEKTEYSLTKTCSDVISLLKMQKIFLFCSIPYAFSTGVRGIWIFSDANLYWYYWLLYKCCKLCFRI